MKARITLGAVALLLLSTGAGATSICRWVNESGQTQIADVVPEKYRKIAICTDTEKYEMSPERREAAQQRAAQDEGRACQAAARVPAGRASNAAPRPAGVASQAGAKRPTEVVTDATDCAIWWRVYDESEECFGLYRTARGATKVEGFDKCNVVASPEPKCGPRLN